MKSIFLAALFAAIIFVPCLMQAGTLENSDLDGYRYQTFGPQGARFSGGVQSGVIYSESVVYDICPAGCELRLSTTGQTLTMEPDDYVIIDHGAMKKKED